jgi:hypothetical protein
LLFFFRQLARIPIGQILAIEKTYADLVFVLELDFDVGVVATFFSPEAGAKA